jgi:hypothetical protein
MRERFLPKSAAIASELADFNSQPQTVKATANKNYLSGYVPFSRTIEDDQRLKKLLTEFGGEELNKVRAERLRTRVHTASLRFGDKFPFAWREEFGL